MKSVSILFLGLTASVLFTFCNENATSKDIKLSTAETNIPSQDFNTYWYQGKAEVISYKLEQARYGEIRHGHAVLIFVTEDFSKSQHVKINRPGEAENDLVKILKLNATRKFNTGIYPYSMMQSVFTPVDLNKYPHSLKTTTSSQEWCGHTFTQVGEEAGNFKIQQFSYFESEGDRSFTVDKVLLEDELWNRIRISPENLPTGKTELIPSMFYIRLKHAEAKPQSANLTLSENSTYPDLFEYKIEYVDLDRILIINFEKDFPHQIISWEETYISGWGAQAKQLTTKASLNKSLFTDYWTKNSLVDGVYRDSLGLE